MFNPEKLIVNLTTKIEKFDVLRGFSILLVFSYHSFLSFGSLGKLPNQFSYKGYLIDFSILTLKGWFMLFSPLFYGSGGVQLFLLISGFLIHHSYLINEKNFTWKGFFNRRFWRIYPPYLLALCFFTFCFVQNTGNSTTNHIAYFLTHLTFTYNLIESHFYQINSSFWSLALECQLYLVYPLILMVRKKKGMEFTFWLTLFVYIVSVIIEILYLNHQITWTLSLGKSWVIWVLGAFLAENHLNNTPVFNKIGWGWLSLLGLLFLLLLWSSFYQYFFHFAFAVLGAILLEKYLYAPRNNFNILEKILAPIGLCSYSMYLFHQPLLDFFYKMISFLGLSNRYGIFAVLDLIIVFCIIFCLSYTLYLFVELPSIELGKRLKKTDTKN